jgi:hypothetical protein
MIVISYYISYDIMTGSDPCSLAFVRYLYDMGILTRRDELYRYRPTIEILRTCSHCHTKYIIRLNKHRDKRVLYTNRCGSIANLNICIVSLRIHYGHLVKVHHEMSVQFTRNEYIRNTINRDMLIMLATYITPNI